MASISSLRSLLNSTGRVRVEIPRWNSCESLHESMLPLLVAWIQYPIPWSDDVTY